MNGVVVAWTSLFTDGDGAGVQARRYGADGAPRDEPFTVNSHWENDQKLPSVASSPDGKHLVVWESKCQESG